MRCRITFSKTEAMRFTSHLDLQRTLERTMRRAGLPLAYSEGFTPRPKMQLASALPLGFTSEAETADFWLKEDLPLEQIEQSFSSAQPPGVVLQRVEVIPQEAAKLQTVLIQARYEISLPEADPDLDSKAAQLMEKPEIPIEKFKKGKRIVKDIRPLIEDIGLVLPPDTDKPILQMLLKAEMGATGRPDDVLQAMGIDPLRASIKRTELIFS